MQSRKTIDVAAAVLIHDNRVLLAKRRGGHLDNLWEFPGGKLEVGESAEHAAKRELHEELDISIIAEKTMLVLEHAYPDITVRLHFVKCRFSDTFEECLQKTIKNPEVGWYTPHDFPLEEFCPADRIAAINLPWPQIIQIEERND